MDTITKMIALIWYIIRDYHANTYTKKQVCAAAKQELERQGHTVCLERNGRIIVDNIPYLIYKDSTWNSYDVRHTIL